MSAQVKAVLKSSTPYYFSEETGTYSGGEYKQGDTVLVIDFTFRNAIVIGPNKRKTFISETALVENADVKNLRKQLRDKLRKDIEESVKLEQEQKQEQEKQRTIDLKKLYGKRRANLIINHLTALGMTDEMVRESIGSPNSITKTETLYSDSEKWAYNNESLYFRNGKVIKIQTNTR